MATSDKQLDKLEWERQISPLGTVLASNIAQTLLARDNGHTALDLACGDGLLTQEICKHFNRVVAIDASARRIETARKVTPDAELHVSLIEDFDPKGETFDHIYMISVIEHLDNPIETLHKVGSWLNANGVLLIYTVNALSLNRRVGQKMGLISDCYEMAQQDIDVGHKRLYDLDKLVADVQLSGLSVLQHGGDMIKPFSNVQMEWFLRSWGEQETDPKWSRELCEALCELGDELPGYANAIWVKCARQ